MLGGENGSQEDGSSTGERPCIADDLGCDEWFEAEWDMWKHIDANECNFKFENHEWIRDSLAESSHSQRRSFYNPRSRSLKCPHCRGNGGKSVDFTTITGLIEHAESDACDLQVDSDSIFDVYGLLSDWAEAKVNEMAEESDDSDEWNDDESDYDSDPEGMGLWWPEFGQTGRVQCVARSTGCRQKFSKASEMLAHFENDLCTESYMPFPHMEEVFDRKMSKEGRQLYIRRMGGFLQCPNFKAKPAGKFRLLSSLVRHAESNVCSLRVRTGPISAVHQALLTYSFNEAMTMDDYESDDSYAMYKYMNSDDEGGYDQNGDVSAAFFARHGYYG
jgi:hypothetical protein